MKRVSTATDSRSDAFGRPKQQGASREARRTKQPIGSGTRRIRNRRRVPGASTSDIAWLLSQLAVMLETGMPIAHAFESLATNTKNPRLHSLLGAMLSDIQAGNPISQAMARHPKQFSPSLVALVRAGEESGRLGEILTKSAEHKTNELLLMRRFRAALAYPALMLLVSLSVIIMLLVFVLPKFVGMFESSDATLPMPTRVVMSISDHLLTSWHWWIVSLLVGSWALFVWSRSKVGRPIFDAIVLRTPCLGPILGKLYQSRSFRGFAVMIESGVPMLRSIEIASTIVPNTVYGRLWARVGERARRGGKISAAFAQSREIPTHMARMIESGDESSRLGFVFSKLASFTEMEFDLAVKSIIQIIEPVMIIVMGAIIGFIAAALMLPLFQAGQVLSS